jgi:hypothetical protein
MITACWRQDPLERPSFAELLRLFATDRRWVLPGTDLSALADYASRNRSTTALPEFVVRDPPPTGPAVRPAAGVFRFMFQERAFALASTTGLLPSLHIELAQRAGAPFVVEADGARVADDVALDPAVTYRVLLVSEQLTVRLETAPLFERVCALPKAKMLPAKQISQLAGLPQSVAFKAMHQGREVRSQLDITRLEQDRIVILRCDPPAAPLSYSFVPRSSAKPLSLAIGGPETVGAVKMRLLAALRLTAVFHRSLILGARPPRRGRHPLVRHSWRRGDRPRPPRHKINRSRTERRHGRLQLRVGEHCR